MKWALGMLVFLAMVSAASAEEFGAIEGRFVLETAAAGSAKPAELDPSVIVHRENGGIAELFIYLRTPPAKIDPALKASREKEVVIESRGGSFRPQAVVVRTDQEIRMINSDRTGFLLQIYGIANSNQLLHVGPNDKVGGTIQLKKVEPIPVPAQADCDAEHAGQWMRLLVVDHPYAAVTDAEGRFRIEGLPTGEHSFRVWHQSRGWLEKNWKVTAVPGRTTTIPPVHVARAKLTPAEPR